MEAGDPKAILALAQMNEEGTGLRINMNDAQEYYQRAADLGEPISQLRLARLIMNGEHIQSNKLMQKNLKEDLEKVNATSSPNVRTQPNLSIKNSRDVNPTVTSGP